MHHEKRNALLNAKVEHPDNVGMRKSCYQYVKGYNYFNTWTGYRAGEPSHCNGVVVTVLDLLVDSSGETALSHLLLVSRNHE